MNFETLFQKAEPKKQLEIAMMNELSGAQRTEITENQRTAANKA